MKLFVFTPYKWDYCGGTIGIIANTYEDAIEVILAEDRKKAITQLIKKEEEITEEAIKSEMYYEEDHFFTSKEAIDASSRTWDHWLLTHTLNVPDETEAKVLFDNWNYS